MSILLLCNTSYGEDKKRYTVFWYTENCGPCKQLEKDFLLDPDMRKKIDEMYIENYHWDAEDPKNEPHIKYGKIDRFPTIAVYEIIDGQFKMIRKTIGYSPKDKNKILDFLEKYKK